ncbi:MAG TPA: cohesin domain-containing protein [Thermoanaerobaculia bacterium]|nr:cohesin domain-containing protein [Thermoanaerobaculia bacterium]
MKAAWRRIALPAPPALAALAALAMVAALAAAGCGGGGGGGTGPTGPPPPTSTIVFTPTAGGNPLLASGAGTQGANLSLELRTTGIQDLYGLAFHLTYPAAAMRFVGAAEGSVLNAGGALRTSFQVVDSPVGNLVVGLTRLGAVAGTAAGGTLLTLQFTGVASGTGNLAFSSNQANNSQGNVIQGLTWSAGTVQVTIVPGSRSR